MPSAASAAAIDAPTVSATAHGATVSSLDSTAVIAEAKRHLGTPYRWGGSTPAGFDCSGFTSYVYAKFGVEMAHSTYSQYDGFERVARKNLRAGDLVFFAGLGHVGIYMGNGRMIHSPRRGKSVEIVKLASGWYASGYVGAVRPAMPA